MSDRYADFQALTITGPDEDGILDILIDTPGKLNAVDQPKHLALADVWRAVDQDPDVRCVVVHGAGGLDELSTTGPSRVSRLDNGQVTTFELQPETLGLALASIDDFLGDTPDVNAHITRDILSGEDHGPRRDIVLLNAAAALSLEDGDWTAGLEAARHIC